MLVYQNITLLLRRKTIPVAAVLVIILFSVGHADECLDKAMTQADMNECTAKAHGSSDAALNGLYQKIQHRLNSDAAGGKRLVMAQRAWIAFRDAECRFASSAGYGGSAAAMVFSQCLDTLTKRRAEDFKSYLSCGGKGDASCPVPAGSEAGSR